MKTNAVRFLESRGAAFELLSYDVDEEDLSAAAVAAKTGQDLERVYKTLALRGERAGVFLCVVPGGEELDLRKAAKASGEKAVELLPLKELLGATGYVRGGCSPLATKKPLPVFVEEAAQLHDRISVSGGARGLQIVIAPESLLEALGAQGSEARYADLV
ncbi:MAG: Cys-tRNA(Pro) deacylase [Spirochaetales bacterium]|nr:Cys-tRNA(Pro) deacylase [Spirochaetales bacterium]